jgi:hypothetical protein
LPKERQKNHTYSPSLYIVNGKPFSQKPKFNLTQNNHTERSPALDSPSSQNENYFNQNRNYFLRINSASHGDFNCANDSNKEFNVQPRHNEKKKIPVREKFLQHGNFMKSFFKSIIVIITFFLFILIPIIIVSCHSDIFRNKKAKSTSSIPSLYEINVVNEKPFFYE